jgi:hypothetical protein
MNQATGEDSPTGNCLSVSTLSLQKIIEKKS